MAGSARMILAVDPDEKSRWESEAQKAGISTAEFLRRAAAQYDPEITPDEMLMLEAAVKELNASAGRMLANLDATLATLAAMNDPGRDARTRARVMAELEANPPRLDFSIFNHTAAA